MGKVEKIHSVYQLRCPIDGEIKYVGSSQDLKQRYIGHLQTPTKCLREWIKTLVEKGESPIMDELESGLERQEAFVRERYWTQKLQTEHGTLLNKRNLNSKAYTNPPKINYLKKDSNETH